VTNVSFQPDVCVFQVAVAQRFALAAGGRDEIKLREQEKLEARKMPENAAESHQSAARFVGTLLTCKTHCLKKNTTAELLKLLHEPLTLATMSRQARQPPKN